MDVHQDFHCPKCGTKVVIDTLSLIEGNYYLVGECTKCKRDLPYSLEAAQAHLAREAKKFADRGTSSDPQDVLRLINASERTKH
jgi:hypothetical protein